MTIPKLPTVNVQKIIRPAVGLLLLFAFAYTGYLARDIQTVQADPVYLRQEQQKLEQQKLRFDRETLDAITSPPPLKPAGNSPFSP